MFQIGFKESVLDYVKRQKVKIDNIDESKDIINLSQNIKKEKSAEKEFQGP